MPRPRRCRRLCCDPGFRYFKPRGVPLSKMDSIELGLDEFEAIRLADLVGMSQTDAAKSMGISQPTFNRTVTAARTKVARSLVEGLALRIGPPINAPQDGVSMQPLPRGRGRCERAGGGGA